MAQLRLPAAGITRKFVHEHDRRAAAGFLVVEFHAVVGGKLRHVARLAIELNLKGKRALVTSASKGIVRACAEQRNRPTSRLRKALASRRRQVAR